MLRFAPSPTGYLHVGNARVALLNYLFAKKNNLNFSLRIDDTDPERSQTKFTTAIKEDIEWLGLSYCKLILQSERVKTYQSIAEELKSNGILYPCYETSEELLLKRRIQLKSGRPPIYDRSALKLSINEKKNFERNGNKPHWRLLLNDDPVEWFDLIHKKVRFERLSISDPILVRSDNTPLFTLTSVIDDIEFKITHILRGDDHITNTAAQINLFKYLGSEIPKFGHFPLLKSLNGEELSKRGGSNSIRELKNQNIIPNVLNTFLAKIGTSFSPEDIKSLEMLQEEFDISTFSKNPIKFDTKDLNRLNIKYFREISYDDIKKILKKEFPESFWVAIKQNIENIEQVDFWLNIINDKNFKNDIVCSDKSFFDIAFNNLPKHIDQETWSKWTEQISDLTGRKGKDLFLGLRLALTGLKKGPEMNLLLPHINRDLILKRLKA